MPPKLKSAARFFLGFGESFRLEAMSIRHSRAGIAAILLIAALILAWPFVLSWLWPYLQAAAGSGLGRALIVLALVLLSLVLLYIRRTSLLFFGVEKFVIGLFGCAGTGWAPCTPTTAWLGSSRWPGPSTLWSEAPTTTLREEDRDAVLPPRAVRDRRHNGP